MGLAKILIAPTIFFATLAGYQIPLASPAPQVAQATYGNYNPTGGGTYYLQSTVSSSQTTITLTSFTEPGSNILYTMSYLNSSIEYATLAPQTSQSEFISFSGITQNSDGSATLTGVVRGLGRSYPYTASTTLQFPHPGQTRLILSNPPQLTNQYLNLTNSNQTITGAIAFGTAPSSTVECAASAEYCTRNFIVSQANQGAATSTEINIGLAQLATAAQTGIGTASSTAGGPLVLQNKFATTTPGTICTSGIFNCIVTAGATGKIAQAFLDLTAAFTWSGTHIFTGAVSILSNASNKLTLNGIAYVFPSSGHASSTALTEDGSGNVKWITPQTTVINATSTVTTISGTTASTTMETVTIPASTLSNATMLKIGALMSTTVNAGFFSVDIGNYAATTTVAFGIGNFSQIECSVYIPGASLEQAFCVTTTGGTTSIIATSTVAGFSTASPIYISFTARPSSSGSGTASFNGTSVILNRQ